MNDVNYFESVRINQSYLIFIYKSSKLGSFSLHLNKYLVLYDVKRFCKHLNITAFPHKKGKYIVVFNEEIM